MYAGCVAGALKKDAYIKIIAEAGFFNIFIAKEKAYTIPDTVLLNYLSQEEINDYKQSGVQILSITIYGEKTCLGSCCAG
jgi:hypothetical protein